MSAKQPPDLKSGKSLQEILPIDVFGESLVFAACSGSITSEQSVYGVPASCTVNMKQGRRHTSADLHGFSLFSSFSSWVQGYGTQEEEKEVGSSSASWQMSLSALLRKQT